MKNHPKLFAIIFILITFIFFIGGVYLEIKGMLIMGFVLWLIAMVFLINAVNCIWDSKRNKN